MNPPFPGEVWHVIAPGPFGGAEAVVHALAAGRHAAGQPTAAFLLLGTPTHPLADKLRAEGVTVHTHVMQGRDYRAQIRALVAAMGTRDVLLHTHGYQADLIGHFAARRAGRPVVATNHGYIGGDLKNRFYEWLDRQMLKRADAVVAVSQRNADRLRAAGHGAGAPITVIPNGWRPARAMSREEARAALGVPGDQFTVGWVGRVSEEKGPDLLIRALQCVTAPGWRAVVIGDGPVRAATEAAVRDAGLGARVTFAGARGDAAALCSAFDVLAISSRTEGLPMVMLEAAGAGAALVAFAVGGIPEYLGERTGWLVPALDVERFAAALDAAAADGAVRQARAAAMRALLEERLGLERWLRDLDAVYRTASSVSRGVRA